MSKITSHDHSYGIGCGKYKDAGLLANKKAGVLRCARCNGLKDSGKYCAQCRKIIVAGNRAKLDEKKRLRKLNKKT